MELIKQAASILAVISFFIAVGGFAISVSTKELVVISETMEIIYEGKALAGILLASSIFCIVLYNLKLDFAKILIQAVLYIFVSSIYLIISRITKKQRNFFLINGYLRGKTYSIFTLMYITVFTVIFNCFYILNMILDSNISLFNLVGFIVIMLVFYTIMLLSYGSYLCYKSMRKVRSQEISFIENNNVIKYVGYLLGEYKQLFCFLVINQGTHKRIFIKKDLVTQVKEQ